MPAESVLPLPAMPDALRIQVAAVAAQHAALIEEELRLGQRRAALDRQEQLRALPADTERRSRQETWAQLRRAQTQWRKRRGQERAILRIRANELNIAARQLDQARKQLEQEQRAWQTERRTLEIELRGVNARIENQRRLIQESASTRHALAESPPPASLPAAAVVDLDRLADQLADQRRQLVEAWQRLAFLHMQWDADRAQALTELKTLADDLHVRESRVHEREQASAEALRTIARIRDTLHAERMALEQRRAA